MSKITWIIFSIITVGFLAVLIIFAKSPELDVSKLNLNAVQTASKQNGNIGDEVMGLKSSKVTLIEYGDFQCPGCGSINAVLRPIIEQYSDRITFIFRNFPIVTSHPNAKAAAAAAISVGLQGKYWEMHHKIYESQDKWSTLTGTARDNYFAELATGLNVDIKKYNTDIASSEVSQKISFDSALALKAKVEATPTFYLNGTKVDLDKVGTAAKFKELIDAEIKKTN